MTYLLLKINVLIAVLSLGGSIYLYARKALELHREYSSKRKVLSQLVVVHQKIKGLFDTVKEENPAGKDSSSFRDRVEKEEEQAPKSNTFILINRLLRKAELASAKNDIAGAEQFLVKAISIDDHHPEVLRNLAFVYLRQEKFSKAELLYTALILNKTEDAVIYSNLGLCLYRQDKLPLAIRASYQFPLPILL
jgi:tetratricopeptide (TPR) repeat protein